MFKGDNKSKETSETETPLTSVRVSLDIIQSIRQISRYLEMTLLTKADYGEVTISEKGKLPDGWERALHMARSSPMVVSCLQESVNLIKEMLSETPSKETLRGAHALIEHCQFALDTITTQPAGAGDTLH